MVLPNKYTMEKQQADSADHVHARKTKMLTHQKVLQRFCIRLVSSFKKKTEKNDALNWGLGKFEVKDVH